MFIRAWNPSRPGLRGIGPLLAALFVLSQGMSICLSHAETPRQFIGFDGVQSFVCSTNANSVVCLSPEVTTRVPWTELIVSWNVAFKDDHHMRLEARALGTGQAAHYYTLALWSADPDKHPRESVNGQKDAHGKVLTDTLALSSPATGLQIRLTLEGGASPQDVLFLGAAVLGTGTSPVPTATNHPGWGHTVDVPRKSQLNYPGGENEWCSPTSISMILNHWSARLSRPDLALDVPAVVKGVHDPRWPGTGNWPFNTAFAGSLPGLRSYVTRMDDVSELEEWILAGYPVATSLSYNILRGRTDPGNGHLVVLTGFTEEGDVIINDPGTRLDNVRRTFPRDAFARAWAVSKNTVYIVLPSNANPPPDPFSHWHRPLRNGSAP